MSVCDLPGNLFVMNANEPSVLPDEPEARRRRVELARQAFKDFYAQCFWSYREDAQILDDDVPWVIRGLRLNGGHRGYRVAAELCH